MLAHDRLGARAFAVLDGVEHDAMMVLRDRSGSAAPRAAPTAPSRSRWARRTAAPRRGRSGGSAARCATVRRAARGSARSARHRPRTPRATSAPGRSVRRSAPGIRAAVRDRARATPRSAANRAASPSSVPRSSIESRMSRSENAFTMKPPDGIASSSPSSSSRTSAIRTGVRETPGGLHRLQFGDALAGPQAAGQDQVAQRQLRPHRLRDAAVGLALGHRPTPRPGRRVASPAPSCGRSGGAPTSRRRRC